jgi:hypothetical protein
LRLSNNRGTSRNQRRYDPSMVDRDEPVEPWWRRWGLGVLAFVLVASLLVIGVNVYWDYFVT